MADQFRELARFPVLEGKTWNTHGEASNETPLKVGWRRAMRVRGVVGFGPPVWLGHASDATWIHALNHWRLGCVRTTPKQ
jgi:hypothetical protein